MGVGSDFIMYFEVIEFSGSGRVSSVPNACRQSVTTGTAEAAIVVPFAIFDFPCPVLLSSDQRGCLTMR